jgi:hypothetical protein
MHTYSIDPPYSHSGICIWNKLFSLKREYMQPIVSVQLHLANNIWKHRQGMDILLEFDAVQLCIIPNWAYLSNVVNIVFCLGLFSTYI